MDLGWQSNVSLNMLPRLVITFLPRSKHLLISWLQSPSAMILEPPKIESDAVCTISPSISHEVMGPDSMIFVFWMLSFKPTFSLSSFTFIKRLFSSSSLSAIRVVLSAYLRLLIFLLAILIPACASTTPRACSNLCPLNQWSHPTNSYFVVPFFSCFQYFPASGSFLMCHLCSLANLDSSFGSTHPYISNNVFCM